MDAANRRRNLQITPAPRNKFLERFWHEAIGES